MPSSSRQADKVGFPDRWVTRCCELWNAASRWGEKGKMNVDRLCLETYTVCLGTRLTDPGVGLSARLVDHRGIVTTIGS